MSDLHCSLLIIITRVIFAPKMKTLAFVFVFKTRHNFQYLCLDRILFALTAYLPIVPTCLLIITNVHISNLVLPLVMNTDLSSVGSMVLFTCT